MAPNNENPSRKREQEIRFVDEKGMNSAENSIASALNSVGDGSLDHPIKRARTDEAVVSPAAATAASSSSAASPPRAQHKTQSKISAESASMPPPMSLPSREVSNCNGRGGTSSFGEKCGGQDGIGSDDVECDDSDDISECLLVEEAVNEIDGRISYSDTTFSDTDGSGDSEENDDPDEVRDKRVAAMGKEAGGADVGKNGSDCNGDRSKNIKCDCGVAADASKEGTKQEMENKKLEDPQECNGDSGEKSAVVSSEAESEEGKETANKKVEDSQICDVDSGEKAAEVSLESDEGKDQGCSKSQEVERTNGRNSSVAVIPAVKCKCPTGSDSCALGENAKVIAADSNEQDSSHGRKESPKNMQKVASNVNVTSDKPQDHPKKHHPQRMDLDYPSPSEDASLTCITVHFHQYGGVAPPSICGITCYYSDDGEVRSGYRRHQVRHRVHIELKQDECITRVQRKISSFDADLGIRFYTNMGRVLTAVIEDGHMGKWYDWDGTEGLGSTATAKSSPSSSPADGEGHTTQVLWSIEYAENYHPSMIKWKSKGVHDLVTHKHHTHHHSHHAHHHTHHRGKHHKDERHAAAASAEPSAKKPATPPVVPVPSLVRLSQAASLDKIRADMLRAEFQRHERLNNLRIRCDHEVEQIIEQHRQRLRDTKEAQEVRRLHRLLSAAMEDLEKEKDRLAERTAEDIAEVQQQKIVISREIKEDWRRGKTAAAKLQQSHLDSCRKRQFDGWDKRVCNEDTCREIFEPSKLPKFKRCVSGSCAKKPRNCGCSVKLCVGCEMYICSRHVETHEKTCPGWVRFGLTWR